MIISSVISRKVWWWGFDGKITVSKCQTWKPAKKKSNNILLLGTETLACDSNLNLMSKHDIVSCRHCHWLFYRQLLLKQNLSVVTLQLGFEGLYSSVCWLIRFWCTDFLVNCAEGLSRLFRQVNMFEFALNVTIVFFFLLRKVDQLTYDLRHLKTGFNNYQHRKMLRVWLLLSLIFMTSPFKSHEWPTQNCSLQYQYNIKSTSDKNKERHLTDRVEN